MPAAPYDSLELIVQTARARLLDAIVSINGEIVTDTAPFTLPMINGAWRRLQENLADKGFSVLDNEVIFNSVAAWTSGDPAVFAHFDWSGYSNGNLTFNSPALPQDAICPIKLYERQSGTNGIFVEMDKMDDGLPTANTGASAGARDILNRVWEWRGNAVYLPGATTTTDIRMRYAAYLADFVAATTTPFVNQPVPIMRALNPFCWYLCAEAARARGDLDAADFEVKGDAAADKLFNRNDGAPRPQGVLQPPVPPATAPFGGSQ